MADQGGLGRIRRRAEPGRARRRLHPRRLFPVFEWLPGYGRGTFAADLAAGLTVGAVLIPQGMAYALVAGLPPVAGLYASVFPILAYAVFGRSRQLALGPVAIVSLLTASGLEPLADGDIGLYVSLAATLALMVGLLMVVMGAARLGFVANFLSHPVLSGFTSAAAIIIVGTQLRNFLRVDLVRSEYVLDVLLDAARRLDEVHLLTLAIGSVGFVLLILLRRWRPAVPWALLVVMVATVVVTVFHLEDRGVQVVGDIPKSLPRPQMPSLEVDRLETLFPLSLAITLVAMVESLAMAQYFAARNRYRIRAGQEFVALGAANATAGIFQGYPVAGSFSRTAVNAASGSRTPVAGLITAAVIGLTLVAAAPLFRPLPRAVLASVVFMAATGLFDVAEARRLWRVKRSDFYLLVLAFGATLALGIERGIAVAVVASLLVMLRQTTRPHVAILGRLPGTPVFRNVERSPDAVTSPGVVVVRVDAPLYFANAEFLKDKLRGLEAKNPGLRILVLDAGSVNDLDSSADRALHEIADDFASRDIHLYLASVKGIILDVMRRSGFYHHLGADHFFLSTDEAVRAAETQLMAEDIPLDMARQVTVREDDEAAVVEERL
ncbi:MAG: SulP family inorganic anion transporter [Acidimicrobiia bacterium]